MGICEYCGKEIEIPYTCKYCGQKVCDKHRLPEQHKCMYLDFAIGQSEIFVIDEKNIFKGTKEHK